MTIQEALNRLSQVLEQDAKGYIWDLQYHLFKVTLIESQQKSQSSLVVEMNAVKWR